MKFVFDWHSQDSRAAGPLEVANTVTAQYGTGVIPRLWYRKCLCRASDNTNAEVVENMATTLKACNVPILAAEVEKCICIQGSMVGRADTNGPQGSGLNNEVSFTLNTIDRHAVAYTFRKTSRPHFKGDAPTYRQLDTANTVNTYKKVKKNKSASHAPAGESIEQRPEEIDGREEFGHWEGDTVYSGKGKRKTTRALLTLTERKTRKEIIIAIPNRKAETVVKALDALERKLGARRFRAIFKSITFDNGTEFAAAEELERSCINKHLPRTKVYFCHPYSSWERGTNENTNGMIRRRFPKGTNFAAVTNAQIAQAENWINNYPRKILGYRSKRDRI